MHTPVPVKAVIVENQVAGHGCVDNSPPPFLPHPPPLYTFSVHNSRQLAVIPMLRHIVVTFVSFYFRHFPMANPYYA
ncbi:hypothetical protein BGLCM_0630 [Bifidobacterium gallicum DSM 20093 = LMG 11596]|uniref:Uncharacterized protein n=1 Tax=Bifidobacterium gallicum DSM 20093 = LMG 11596 TaxID=561180 RepID=A0A087AJU6_9BIFI|nr:hypothetical protein BGLCM_0630 [Bifidobacterium gallicum DSM 20093 = LMG 11596]